MRNRAIILPLLAAMPTFVLLQGGFSEIKKVMQDTSSRTINFVSGFGTWSSDMLYELGDFVRPS
jgi:hypothetical protein